MGEFEKGYEACKQNSGTQALEDFWGIQKLPVGRFHVTFNMK